MRTRESCGNRILDAAAQLMRHQGYKRVTIDDVAKLAGISKSTIYQHWADREALFCDVLERDFAAAAREAAAAIRQDPETVLLHRMTRTFFFMRRPILRAIIVVNGEVPGKLAKLNATLQARAVKLLEDYLQLLTDYGLLRPDISSKEVFAAYRAAIMGFFLPESAIAAQYQVSLEGMADLVTTVVQRAFEQEGSPPAATVHAIAPRVIELFTKMADVSNAHLREVLTSPRLVHSVTDADFASDQRRNRATSNSRQRS